VRDDKVRTVARATQTWTVSSDDYTVKADNYGQSAYESYYVNGAQLVSKALQAPLSETEGLGFNLNSGSVSLSLDMQDDVPNSGEKAQPNVGDSYKTWKGGKLSIGAGGKIVVPKPGANFNDFYIYIRSSQAPTSVTNANKMIESGTASSGEEVDSRYDVGANQYKYHFTANANAEITFGTATDVYAIGVTNLYKEMTPLSSKGWATESRDVAIDYTLDSLLTTRPLQAFAVIETDGNPLYCSTSRPPPCSACQYRTGAETSVGYCTRSKLSSTSLCTCCYDGGRSCSRL